ncbi:hypothetical protein CC78DRAFT_622005 [Lojkania enalia]|uniref:Uncharacterized protein n=1 Tax=Lojkania enalia TaxID=147567 RepID=A0A9P4JW34_9PLEO|nr:hypothetical protein CC78DRAFT_622005 [Didymosphaeria enalia]
MTKGLGHDGSGEEDKTKTAVGGTKAHGDLVQKETAEGMINTMKMLFPQVHNPQPNGTQPRRRKVEENLQTPGQPFHPYVELDEGFRAATATCPATARPSPTLPAFLGAALLALGGQRVGRNPGPARIVGARRPIVSCPHVLVPEIVALRCRLVKITPTKTTAATGAVSREREISPETRLGVTESDPPGFSWTDTQQPGVEDEKAEEVDKLVQMTLQQPKPNPPKRPYASFQRLC